MSNLVKPYEISVWDDIWDSVKGKFIEKKLLVIGTDEMTSLNRALEPVLTRNVNGTKKFSFKMYKRYIDRETGEEVHNLFIDYLINERKIKLKYGVDDEGNDKWYDFIIKNVNETSTTYLYQFDLEDAIVQELSKNGFGVTLDAQLNNNMGTADELAKKVLADTDWTVVGSDKLVQEVKEHLVYVSAPATLEAWALKNGGVNYDSDGVIEEPTTLNTTEKTILAFYSSCTGKPHRFQFIILPDYIETNEDNVIINKDCQYFIECNPDDYTVKNTNYGFVLPTGWSVQTLGGAETGDKDTTVSHKYRGNRFGYAQQAVYLPKLDRYVNKYTNSGYKNTDGTDKIIYGYVDNKYVSPVLMTNLISNTEFKNTSGWKGVGYTSKSTLSNKPTAENKPIVENVYGRFDGNNFISAMTDLTNGVFSDKQAYEAYMKLDFSQTKVLADVTPIVINSGPCDNRTIIDEIIEGDEWALYVEDRDGNWPTNLTFTLEEVKYDSDTGCYKQTNSGKISFTSSTTTSPQIFTFGECGYSDKTFKKNVKLHLKITEKNDQSDKGIYYIKTIELHKVVRDKDDEIIRLNAQADKIDEGIVNTKYFYFTEDAYNTATTKDEIEYIHTADKAEPSIYKPVYNARAEKIRSVTAKESNYFNILQSIAETFEAWLDLKITRDANGAVTGKQVSFKKYSGGDNYAAFRYGVNLKDITRTTESKQIVTKLIVKNNSNELAPNKFCTIQRAPSNISGENYIYDFQYYYNNGLLNAEDYLNELYYTEGATGKDIDLEHTDTNIKGYFPRLKTLNNQLVELNEQMSGLSQELLQLKAEREVAEATYEAAESGIEQTSEDFETLTGFGITAYSVKQITSSNDLTRISAWPPEGIENVNESSGSYLVSEELVNIEKYPSLSLTLNSNAFTYTLNLSRVASDQALKTINATLYTPIKVGSTADLGVWIYQATSIKFKFKSKTDDATGYTTANVEGTFNAVDTERSDIKKLLTEYLTYQQEKTKSEAEKGRLATLIDGDAGKQKQYDNLKQKFENIRDNQKSPLNKVFFQKYSRFIQEGTWIDEQYVDDEKYYNDAQTVLYNSCYPKVGYTINVLSLSKMPGYECFVFDVGEKTYAEDEEFFGTDVNGYPNRTEIIIAEMSEHLDNPSADSIKVQNFKNQFQDLFQKITATVQQTQYNEGTYRKGAALVEATNAKKNEFLLDSLSDPESVLSNAGQNEVIWDNSGITITNSDNRAEQLRLVSSGIMFSTDSEGGPKWSTGITPQGISANKILAGSINTGEISLMNGKDTSFLWNAFGINAFDYTIENGTIVGVNKNKFVRFDRNGIYGINGLANADTWTPEDLQEIDDKATFALTWEGLKVTGNNGVVARIGKQFDSVIDITKNGQPIFKVSNDGDAVFSGDLRAAGGTFTGELSAGSTTKGTNILTIDDEGILINNQNGVPILKINDDGFRVYAGGTESEAFHINSNGDVTIGSEAGTNLVAVGGFSIEGDSLYTQDKTSLGMNIDGVLIDPNHISLGAYDAFRILNTGDVSLSKISVKPRPAGKPRNILSTKLLLNEERTYTLSGESVFFSSNSLKGLISRDKKYRVVFEAKIDRTNCYIKTDFIPDDLENSESTIEIESGEEYQIYSSELGPLSNLTDSTDPYLRFFWNNEGNSNNNNQIGYTISIRNVMLLELLTPDVYDWTQGSYYQADEDTWSLIADSQGLVLNNSPIQGDTYRVVRDNSRGWWSYQVGLKQEGSSSVFYVAKDGQKRINIDAYGEITLGWENSSSYSCLDASSLEIQSQENVNLFVKSDEVRFTGLKTTFAIRNNEDVDYPMYIEAAAWGTPAGMHVGNISALNYRTRSGSSTYKGFTGYLGFDSDGDGNEAPDVFLSFVNGILVSTSEAIGDKIKVMKNVTWV